MKMLNRQNLPLAALLFLTLCLFSSCLTSSKMDRFVADYYGGQLPKAKKKPELTVLSAVSSPGNDISTTVQKTSKVLPLIVYWQWDYRHTCTLNPAIGVNSFAGAVNALYTKGLSQKLNGQQLELTVEQIPNAFALVDKAHMIWLIYAFSWDKIYMEPDGKDLVVSYKLTGTGNGGKTGKIAVKNPTQNKGLRFFQSWKSATSEYLADYNTSLAAMAKTFVTQLMTEL